MDFPELASFQLLEQRHAEWHALYDAWDMLMDFREGAPTLLTKREKYLPQRPGEPNDLYRIRLDKFSYSPILTTAIKEYTAKLASAPLHISGIEQSDRDRFWATWMERCDGKQMDLSELVSRLFSSALYYGRVHVAVEKPYLGYSPRNRAEEPADALPYLLFYDPLLVTNWGDGWYLTRQINTIQVPLQPPKTIATWVYWTGEATVTYQAEVKLDRASQIQSLVIDGKPISTSLKEAMVPKLGEVRHRLGRPTLVSLTLNVEDWVGAQAYLKQRQHLQIESSWTDSGTMAGVVQRVYVPPAPVPDGDTRVTYSPPDLSGMNFDNQHVVVGDFKFVESTGDAINNLTGQLDKIEHQIRSIASMGWQSVTPGALEQSGISKIVDQALMNDSLKRYGKAMTQVLQDILQSVGKMAGRSDVPNVGGLDTYSVDSLSAMLEAAGAIEQLKLPPTAMKLWTSKLVNLLTGSVSPEDQVKIQAELEALFSGSQIDDETVQG